MSDSMTRKEALAMMQMALADQAKKHALEIEEIKSKERETVYNNRPRQKRNAQWQQQLAALEEAAEQRALKTWGQNAVGNYLREKGIGCNNTTAADLVTILVDNGFLKRSPKGKVVYIDKQKAA